MVGSHANDSDGGKYTKSPRTRNRIGATLERNVKNMTTYICYHGEKEEYLEEDIIYTTQTFDTARDECQKKTNIMTITLNIDVDEGFRMVEYLLNSIVTQVKYLEDTINMLK